MVNAMVWRRILQCACFVLFLICSLAGAEQDNTPVGRLPITLDTSEPTTAEQLTHGGISLGHHLEYVALPPDTTWSSLNLADGLWQPVAQQVPNFGLTNQNYWLRTDIRVHPGDSLLIDMSYPMVDHLEFFWLHQGRLIKREFVGDGIPFNHRHLKHRNFLYEVPTLKGTGELQLFILAKTDGAMQLPLRLWRTKVFYEEDQYALSIRMFFIGILAAIAAYNLLLLIALRDITYGLYVATVVLSTLTFTGMWGMNQQYLWPNGSAFNNIIMPVIMLLNAAVVGLFSIRFLNAKKYIRGWYWASLGVSVYGALGVIGCFVLPYSVSVTLAALIVAIGSPFYLLMGLAAWHAGQPLGKFYALAWSSPLIGHTFMALNKFGVVPRSFWFEYLSAMGVVIEVLLLSFALAYRINLTRKKQAKAQADLFALQQETNEQLEARVKARTEELEHLNIKLKEVSQHDALTGLHNRRYFDDLLAKEWRRSWRTNTELAVLLVDIDHFKDVNDTYGHPVGDACLRHLGRLFSKNLKRAGDSCARYGGEEFVFVFPNTNKAQVLTLAERLRSEVEQMPVELNDTSLLLTISVGAACVVPSAAFDPEDLLKCADQALYQAKRQGRNCAVFKTLEKSCSAPSA